MIGAQAHQTSDTLSDEHRQVITARGISLKMAAAAGLRTASAVEAKDILGFDPKSRGILIPYTHPISGEIRTYRFRPDIPLVIDGKPAKYLSPRGVGNLFYFPPNYKKHAGEAAKPKPTVMTEGEFKTLAGADRGLLTVGLIGVYGWRARNASGGSGAIADFDLLKIKGEKIAIVFDSDVALNAQVRKARHGLGKELYRRGADTVYTVDLPASNGKKVGLDDFLATRDVESLFSLDLVELPRTDLPLFTEPISVLLNEPDEPIEWGIEGILPLDASGWIIAGPKVGKSWDMLEEAFCLATAQPLYGHFRVPEKRRVLVIEEEDPRRRIKHRIRRIIHARGGIAPEDEFLRTSIKKGFRLDAPDWREVFAYEIEKFRPQFIFLDVFSRIHTQDMNDQAAMADLVLFLDQLNREHGAAFRILHHTRKAQPGSHDFDEILGSRVLGGFADTTMFLSRTKERGVLRVRLSLKDEPEDGTFEPDFQIRLKDTEDQLGTSFEYLGKPPEKEASQVLREKIRNALEAAGDWLTVKELMAVVGASRPTIKEHLSALVDLQVLDYEKRKNRTGYYRVKKG